jgi:hypothetical protein
LVLVLLHVTNEGRRAMMAMDGDGCALLLFFGDT